MTIRPVLAATAICALTVTACSGANATSSHHSGPTTQTTPTHTTPTPPPCRPAAGGRCPGPATIDNSLVGHLYLASRSQLAIHGDFLCGGRLRATESKHQVAITYLASAVGAGGLACAKVTLSVRLHEPLDGRTVIDALTGERLTVGVLANS